MLFLGPNGKPVYFGELGPGCTTLTQYFEQNGAISCPPEGNPAEYMMEITGCAPGTESDIDWPNVWRSSPEFAKVHQELEHMERTLQKAKSYVSSNDSDNQEFAAPFLCSCGNASRGSIRSIGGLQLIFTRRLHCVCSRYVRVFHKKGLKMLIFVARGQRRCFLGSHFITRITPCKAYRTRHSVSSCYCKSTTI